MTSSEQPLNKAPSPCRRRQSDDGSTDDSCVDLYADVERNFRVPSSSQSTRSPVRSSRGQGELVSSRSVQSSSSTIEKDNLSSNSHSRRYLEDSIDDADCPKPPSPTRELLDLQKKDSLKSEGSNPTKPIDYEYEVPCDDSPGKVAVLSDAGKLKPIRRSLSPKRSEPSQHSVAHSTGSLRSNTAPTRRRTKTAEEMDRDERTQRSIGSKSQTGSHSARSSHTILM